jgi:hypothetical protein
MKKIFGAMVLLGLSGAAFVIAAQESERRLTKKAIEDAAKDLQNVEMTLVHLSGEKSEGSSTVIRGDGTVVQSRSEYYPLTAEEKLTTRKLRIALSREDAEKILRLFASDEVLALPKIHPELITPKDVWPKSMRYSLGLSIAGVGSFEGEHPDVDWSKLPQSRAARNLIQAIRKSVAELTERIAQEDAEFLTQKRLLGLTAGFALELNDIQGLWGGKAVRVHADGRVEGVSVRPPKQGERGMQVRHFKGTVQKNRVVEILKAAAELGTFDLRPKRATGIPDEVRPVLEIQATFSGVIYSRSIAMWGGEAQETAAFQQVRKALRDIAAEQLQESGK